MANTWRFFYHFNKPMTQKTGEVMWSIHFRNKCYFVKDISCMVPTVTKTNKKQPKGVVQGFCKEVLIKESVAIIQ